MVGTTPLATALAALPRAYTPTCPSLFGSRRPCLPPAWSAKLCVQRDNGSDSVPWLQGPAFEPDARERTKRRPDLEWNWGHTFTRVTVDNQRVSSVLSHLLRYNFTLPRVVSDQRGAGPSDAQPTCSQP